MSKSQSTISVKAIKEKIDRNEPFFLLDVRNKSDYKDWRIEGETVESLNIPASNFFEDEEGSLKQLPKDRDIIVTCARGISALDVTSLLTKKGYQAIALEGGMLQWSQVYLNKLIIEDQSLKLYQVNRLAKGCLSYMLISNGQALVLDPSRHIDEYTQLAHLEDAQIKHVLDSHLHADHISGGYALAKETDSTYYLSSSDAQEATIDFEPLEKHKLIHVGDATVKIYALSTPGHTPGSISILINDQYFLTGDTLFVGGLGRPDLGGKTEEWAEFLYYTVFETLKDLSDDVLILPAHYAGREEMAENGVVYTTLGDLRKKNQAMQTKDLSAFKKMVISHIPNTPPNHEEIIAVNRGRITVDTDYATELEIGPNRCAAYHG